MLPMATSLISSGRTTPTCALMSTGAALQTRQGGHELQSEIYNVIEYYNKHKRLDNKQLDDRTSAGLCQ
jgi:hypothetical protein